VSEQMMLVDVVDWRTDLWFGMPEFVQDSAEPVHSILIHFETMQDVERLGAILGQRLPLGPIKASTWYPAKQPERYADKQWVSE
jgi:hypothetical protein